MEIINEFENMKELAELKALSKFSLEHPLDDKQLLRMKELFKKHYGEQND